MRLPQIAAAAKALPPTQWFTEQRVDHFDGANADTFGQRYWVNDTFWKAGPTDGSTAARSVAFLCVGGEGPPLDGSVVVESIHCNDAVELAPKLGALVVALEHRYYGESVPTEDFSTPNLRYLSSHQALADLANFRVHVAAQYGADDVMKCSNLNKRSHRCFSISVVVTAKKFLQKMSNIMFQAGSTSENPNNENSC